MSHETPTTPPNYPPPKVLDAVFLGDTYEELRDALWRAKHEVSYFRREICSLVTEPELPAAFRGAYGRIVSLLEAIEQTIIAGDIECFHLRDEALSAGLFDWDQSELNEPPVSAELAKNVITQINAAEARLTNVVKSAKRGLMNHAEQGLIDWSMPYNCEFTVVFNPGPTRRFYDTCGDGEEPLRFRIRPPFRDMTDDSGINNETTNWNIFKSREDHPLREGHHGYLVHCLLDHMHLPWQLLPHIREIEVSFAFTDFECAWAASTR
jgi:hypothetical protein